MEVSIERVYLRCYKARLRRGSLSKYNKNLLRIIFGFLNTKEILAYLLVSKAFAQVSQGFFLVEKYIKTSLNLLLGDNGRLMTTLMTDVNEEIKPHMPIFGELLIEFFLKKEIFFKNNDEDLKCFKISNTIGAKGLQYLTNVLDKFRLTDVDLTGNKIGDEGLIPFLQKLRLMKQLKRINFSNNHLTCNGFKNISESLPYFIEMLNISYNLPGEEGCRSLNTLYLAHCSKLKEIYLTNCKIKPVEINEIIKGVINSSSILCADFSSNEISDEGCVEIAKLHKKNASLKKIDLSGNKITSIGCNTLLDGLNLNENLESLTLNLNKINHLCMKNLSEYLSNSNLKILNLKNNNLSAEGANLLSTFIQTSNLKQLNLSGNAITDLGVKYLLQELSSNTQLENLNLSNNELTDDCCEFVQNFLTQNRNLKHFSLSNNEISEKGAKNISEALIINSSLEHFELNDNTIQDSGADFIFSALINSKNSQLKELNLGQNTIGNYGISKLPILIERNLFTVINLKSNCIDSKGVKEISEVLCKNKSLITLDFGYNQLTDEGVTLLIEALKLNVDLKVLDISHNKITKKFKEVIEAFKMSKYNLTIIS